MRYLFVLQPDVRFCGFVRENVKFKPLNGRNLDMLTLALASRAAILNESEVGQISFVVVFVFIRLLRAFRTCIVLIYLLVFQPLV